MADKHAVIPSTVRVFCLTRLAEHIFLGSKHVPNSFFSEGRKWGVLSNGRMGKGRPENPSYVGRWFLFSHGFQQ